MNPSCVMSPRTPGSAVMNMSVLRRWANAVYENLPFRWIAISHLRSAALVVHSSVGSRKLLRDKPYLK